MAASLLNGRLVAMELWDPLPCVMEIGLGDNPPSEQPIGAVIQQVSMWDIPSATQKKKSKS